ncbi:MAG: hypothetical protein QOE89_3345 [Pseudonocardiales bacterium]|jgi:precorrin isomerase|nr:hypothetical protein [Pseudonocardiales bacterium]
MGSPAGPATTELERSTGSSDTSERTSSADNDCLRGAAFDSSYLASVLARPCVHQNEYQNGTHALAAQRQIILDSSNVKVALTTRPRLTLQTHACCVT